MDNEDVNQTNTPWGQFTQPSPTSSNKPWDVLNPAQTPTTKLKPSDDNVTFFDAVNAGVQTLGNAGTALQAAFAGSEKEQEILTRQYKENQQMIAEKLSGATDWRDIVDSDSIGEGFGRTLDFIKEQFGMNSPQMVAIMTGGLGGAAASPYLPHPVASAVSKVGGFAVGATMAALPMYTGFNVGRQIDEGKEINLMKAGAYAVPQAATEAFLAGIFSKTGLTTVGTKMFGELSDQALGRVGQKIGEALTIGIPAEVIQQGFERASADLEVNPMSSDEALQEYLDAGISAAAALSPMGIISAIPQGKSRKASDVAKITQEETQQLLKADIDSSPEPKQNAIKTYKEAEQALGSIGINPEAYTKKGAIRAANVMIDRSDAARMGFLEGVVPKGSDIHKFLSTSTSFKKSPIKTMVDQKQQIPSAMIEQTNIEDLATIFTPTIPQQTPIIPKIDLEASREVLGETSRIISQMRKKSLTGPPIANKPTQGDLAGTIVADVENMMSGLKPVFRQNKSDLIETARKNFKIPDKDLKDSQGQYLKKEDIASLIVEKRAETYEPFQVKPREAPQIDGQIPLQRVNPKAFDAITGNMEGFIPSVEASPQVTNVVQHVKRISKELKTKLNVDKDLKINPKTRDFVSPMKAAQAGNMLFTTVNYNNVASYPDLTTHLQETWAYYFDSLPTQTRETLRNLAPSLASEISRLDDTLIGNLETLMKTPQGKDEVISHVFARLTQGERVNKKIDMKVPTEFKTHFQKLTKTIERSKGATKGLGISTFEDVFPAISEKGVTPREAIFDNVYNLRQERLQSLSDAIQFDHWQELDKTDIRKDMDEAIRAGQKGEAMKQTGLWAKSVMSSFAHLASVNPVASVAYNLSREQETLQSRNLVEFNDAGEVYFREKSKEVRSKAAEVLDLLRNTEQKLRRDHDGNIVFERDNQLVIIKNPDMIAVIESLDKWGKTIINKAEGETRVGINELIPDALTMTMDDIQQAVRQIEIDKALDVDDIEFLKDQVKVLENLQVLKSKPFVPHMRFGAFGFTVHKKSSINEDGRVKPDAEPVYHSQVEKGHHKKRWNKDQYKRVQSELQQYRNNKDYVIFEDTHKNPFEMTYGNIYDKLSRDNITLELLAGLVGSDKTEKYVVDVKDKMDRKTKYRGFKRRFGESQNIEGYSTDWDRVINAYNMGSAHFFAKAKFAPLKNDYAEKVRSDLSINEEWLKKKVGDYIEYTNSPHDSFQKIRSINFLWTMGGNFSTAALQVMTLPTTSLGSMSQYNPNPISNMNYLQKFFRIAFKEFSDSEISVFEDGVFILRFDNPKLVENLKTKHKFTDSDIQFLNDMFQDGRTGAAFLEEQTGQKNFETRSTSGKMWDKWGKVSHLLGTPISAMEQATRFATAMAHYKMFTDNPQAVTRALKVLENDYRFQQQRKTSNRSLIADLAYFGMDEAHAVFGKVGRGDALRGGFGAFMFPFMTYPQHAVEFMGRMAGRGPEGKQALAVTAGALFMFSGLLGLPGGELAKELLEEVYKATSGEEVDLEMLIREKLNETTGDPRPGMFVTQGLFRAFLNMDVSRRIGIPIMGQDLLLAMMGVRGDMTDLLGVQGSMMTQGIDAWNAYKRDEAGVKVASYITPAAVANVLKAYTYDQEGVKTKKGTQLVSQKDIQENQVEVFSRLMGITTGRIASKREAQFWTQQENNRFKPKMNSFRSKGKMLATKMYAAINAGQPKIAEKYRKKYIELTNEVTNFLNKKKFPYDMRAFHRAVIDAVDQSIHSNVRLKDLNKPVKNRLKPIKEVSGSELFEEEN